MAWLIGVGAAAVFLVATPLTSGSVWRWTLILLLVPSSAWWVRYCLASLPAGQLNRDLQGRWFWLEASSVMARPLRTWTGQAATVAVVMDLQQALLLDLHTVDVPRPARSWLWVERPDDMSHAEWLAFRRAVYSPAMHEAPVPVAPEPS